MLKVNEFEHGISANSYYGKFQAYFSEDANIQYELSEDYELKDVVSLIRHHNEVQAKRLNVLQMYFKAKNEMILNAHRRKEADMADYRNAHAFAPYISNFITNVACGENVKIQASEQYMETLDELAEFNDINDTDRLNYSITLDISRYGRAYEMLFRDKHDNTRTVKLNPMRTFIVYDDTILHEPLIAVRYTPIARGGGFGFEFDIIDDKSVTSYETKGNKVRLVDEEQHAFGVLPVFEYANNEARTGDYEIVLPLIDAYDSAQSDTSNYMTDLNDAILAITGNVGLSVTEARKMKDANLLLLTPPIDKLTGKEGGSVDAKYLYKQYDVNGSEAYKSRIANDIHKFTYTPDMNDHNFAGTQSGEAMKYKLFGLLQNVSIKQQELKRGLKKRYKLLQRIKENLRETPIDISAVSFIFDVKLPSDSKEQIENFKSLGGTLSQRTLLEMLPANIVDDVDEEIERYENENPQSYDYMERALNANAE